MAIIWNQVTRESKWAALVFFLIVLPILTFYIGMKYQETVGVLSSTDTTATSTIITSTNTNTNTSTNTNATTSNSSRLPADLKIKFGETKSVGGLSITFNKLVQDSRCPIDVQCIQAGAVTINVTFKADNETKTFNMPSDEVPQEFQGYKISIKDVEPPLRSGTTAVERDMVVTFTIAR